jgi:hypothetical protein
MNIVSRAESWAAALRDANESVLDAAMRLLSRQRVLDVLTIALLLAVGIYSAFHGFELWRLINGDQVFAVHVQSFAALEYRAPPSNGLFPDVLLHLMVAPLISDPLTQKLTVGWLLAIASILFIGLRKGPMAALAVAVLLSLSDFEYVDSTSHYSLPLMLLMYQLARPVWLKHSLLLLITFSDVLIVIPLIALFLTERDQPPLWQSFVIVAIGSFAGEVVYSEISRSLLKVSIVAFVFAIGAVIANRFGLLKLMCVLFGLMLVAGAIAGIFDTRYAYPVAMCLLLVFLPTRNWTMNWRYLALPAALLGVFAATASTTQLHADARQFDCFLDLLQARHIDSIATDHWMSIPLDMAARKRGQSLSIAQVDFTENRTDLWMAPYAFAGVPTRYGLRNPRICTMIGNDTDFCGQDAVAPVITVESVCEGLELFTYADPVPSWYSSPPANKLDSILGNFRHYLDKLSPT